MVDGETNNKTSREKVRNTLNRKPSKKRHAKKQHSPAQVPLPDRLALLLEFANLIPVYLRHPSWARRNTEMLKDSKLALYEDQILHWRWGEESHLAKLGRWLEKEVAEKGKFNTPYLLWVFLYAALEELPLALKIFILHDRQGEKVEYDGQLMPLGVDPAQQAWLNLHLIKKSHDELIELGLKAVERIEAKIEEEEAGKLIHSIPDLDSPTQLLSRVRERLILAFGVQDLLSCLIYPEKNLNLFYGSMYYYSSASTSHFYLNKEGKISFTPSPLAELLEGIEAVRVRECPVCYKYFWAGRKDMRGCSPQCSHTLRQRKFRERYQERYKQQRYKKAEEQARKRLNQNTDSNLDSRQRRKR